MASRTVAPAPPGTKPQSRTARAVLVRPNDSRLARFWSEDALAREASLIDEDTPVLVVVGPSVTDERIEAAAAGLARLGLVPRTVREFRDSQGTQAAA